MRVGPAQFWRNLPAVLSRLAALDGRPAAESRAGIVSDDAAVRSTADLACVRKVVVAIPRIDFGDHDPCRSTCPG